jgi:predicted transcriptional regulator
MQVEEKHYEKGGGGRTLSRNETRMLVYLQNVDEASSRELEKGTGLHQPEVSIAAKDLNERDWINRREVPKTGKGRPYKMFSLKISFSEIIDQLKKAPIGAILGLTCSHNQKAYLISP